MMRSWWESFFILDMATSAVALGKIGPTVHVYVSGRESKPHSPCMCLVGKVSRTLHVCVW